MYESNELLVLRSSDDSNKINFKSSTWDNKFIVTLGAVHIKQNRTHNQAKKVQKQLIGKQKLILRS